MKPLRAALLFGCVAVATGCMPRREPPPPPPAPIERPAPPPVRAVPPPPPTQTNWQDLPLTPGRWFYRNEGGQSSTASFGPAESAPSFTVRCDRTSRQVTLSRGGITTGNSMTVRTSYSARSLPLVARTEPLNSAFASLPASDRFLDGMAFSRGRFTVEVPGTPMLIIPAWPEPARVVEDCRG